MWACERLVISVLRARALRYQRSRDGHAEDGSRPREQRRGGAGGQSVAASGIADFLLAAWFLWMTPAEAAWSSLRLATWAYSFAWSVSPASTASLEAPDGRLEG